MIYIFVDQYQILIRLFQTMFFRAEVVVPIWQDRMVAFITFWILLQRFWYVS